MMIRTRRFLNSVAGSRSVSYAIANSAVSVSVLVVFLLASFVPVLSATLVELSFREILGTYSVSFDSSRISEDDVRKLLIFSPFVDDDTDIPNPHGLMLIGSWVGKTLDKGLLAPALERCLKSDLKYVNCNSNDFPSPNFFRNAEANLQKGRSGLTWLDHLVYPAQLKPVVKYLRDRLAVSLWIQETRLSYYKSWNESILRKNYDGLHPAQFCQGALKKLEGAGSNDERYHTARYDWANCMNGAADERYGHRYPIDSWNAFLQALGIKERYKDESPD